MAHLTVTGAAADGGGERQAQSIFEYHVPAAAFPAELHYVALGHLHRRQSVPAPCPVHYSGSPLRVDFGEVDSAPVVLLVDAAPGTPARVTDLPITAARTLRTRARHAGRAGGRDGRRRRPAPGRRLRAGPGRAAGGRARAAAGRAGGAHRPGAGRRARPSVARARTDRAPGELLRDYLRTREIADPRVEALFARLHEEITTGDEALAGGSS